LDGRAALLKQLEARPPIAAVKSVDRECSRRVRTDVTWGRRYISAELGLCRRAAPRYSRLRPEARERGVNGEEEEDVAGNFA